MTSVEENVEEFQVPHTADENANAIVTLDNTSAVLQKLNSEIAALALLFPRSRRTENKCSVKICTQIFITTFFIVSNRWAWLKYQLMNH